MRFLVRLPASRLPVCPPGGFEFTTDVWAELRYVAFNPLGGQNTLPYYLRAKSWDYCYAFIHPLTGQLVQQPATQVGQNINLYVDVMFLTGGLSLNNPGDKGAPREPVTVDDKTRYNAFDASTKHEAGRGCHYVVRLRQRRPGRPRRHRP